MSVITGSKDAFLQPSEYGRTEVGQFATVPYESVDPNIINTLALQFDKLGYRYRVQHNFGKHRLEVFLSYNNAVSPEVPVSLWEYNAISAQKELWNAEVPSALTSGLSAKLKNLIASAYGQKSNNLGPDPTTGLIFDPTSAAWWLGILGAQNSADADTCANVYQVLADGTDSFEVSVPMLRHTLCTSKDFNLALNFAHVNLILSPARMLQEGDDMPLAIANNLPTFVQDATPHQFGWKKNFPSVNNIGNQKIQAVQEYQWGKWDTRVFGDQIKAV